MGNHPECKTYDDSLLEELKKKGCSLIYKHDYFIVYNHDTINLLT